MRRFACFWLPSWPTDRWRRCNRAVAGPLALVAAGQGGLRLTALDAQAAAEGLTPGVTLADARALVPELFTAPAAPQADAEALQALAFWCRRYAPWTAMDGGDGLVLEITGCAALFGGEAALLAAAAQRFAAAGIALRPAIADTPAAAWAWARFRPATAALVLPPGEAQPRLGPLPVAALRLPEETVSALSRVGLRSIAELLRLPRGPLAARYGAAVGRRLDRLLGLEAEPIAPPVLPRGWMSRLGFAEPITERAAIEHAANRLLTDLCRQLSDAGRGARRLTLACFRVDATAQSLAIGTSRAVQDASHLLRLFREKFDRLAPGFGIEAMLLEATATEPLAAVARRFDDPADGSDLAQLLDRLRSRLGEAAVRELVPRDSHVPERVQALRPASIGTGRDTAWPSPASAPRPILLLDRPEPIAAAAPAAACGFLPVEPPGRFLWRGRAHRLLACAGPERLTPEWWRGGAEPAAGARDYYRIETAAGQRLWVFRRRGESAWQVQGIFA